MSISTYSRRPRRVKTVKFGYLETPDTDKSFKSIVTFESNPTSDEDVNLANDSNKVFTLSRTLDTTDGETSYLMKIDFVGKQSLYKTYYDNQSLAGTKITFLVKTIEERGMESCFENSNLLGARLDLLESVDDSGLQHAFAYTNLTGDFWFSNLKKIGKNGLFHIFEGTEVVDCHLSYTLKSQYEKIITPEYLGITGKVLWDADRMWNLFDKETKFTAKTKMWEFYQGKDEDNNNVVVTKNIWGNRMKSSYGDEYEKIVIDDKEVYATDENGEKIIKLGK